MKKYLLFCGIIFILFSLTFCATTPPPEEEEPAVEEEAPPEEPAPEEPPVVEEKPEPVTDEEIQVVKDQIEKAERVFAETHSPQLLKKAEDTLDNAVELRESDPDESRRLLSDAEENAKQAYSESITKIKEIYNRYLAELKEIEEELKGVRADLFAPGEVKKLYEQAQRAQQLYESEKYGEAQKEADGLIASAEDLHERITSAIEEAYESYITKLKDSEQKLKDVEADKFTPEKTEYLYRTATEAQRLFESGEYLEAREKAEEILASADSLYREVETDKKEYQKLKQDAELAIEEAKNVQALNRAPDTMRKASDLYSEGLKEYENYNLKEGQEAMRMAKNSADRARSEAIGQIYDTYLTYLKKMEQKLKNLEADKFAPDGVKRLYERASELDESFRTRDFFTVKKEADELVKEVNNFYDTLSERIRYANILMRDANWLLKDALDVRASRWAPDEIKEAQELLDKGKEAYRGYNLEKSIEFFSKAREKAKDTYYLARRRMREAYYAQFEKTEGELKTVRASKFAPEETAKIYSTAEEIEKLYKKEQYAEAERKAGEALSEANRLITELKEKINRTVRLRREVEIDLEESKRVEAYIWASNEIENATVYYARALEAFRRYNLTESLKNFELAREYSRRAVAIAPRRKAEEETKALMIEVGREIEEASEFTVITEEGEIIKPQLWRGARPKSENPRSDNQEDNQSMLIPSGESDVAVLGDVSTQNLLERAKEQYMKGLEAQEQGDFERAKSYFEEAGRLAYAYKQLTKVKIYSVQKTNCLWKITDRMYNNPFLWPLVWVANMKLIRDPDLIYPGWELIIPER